MTYGMIDPYSNKLRNNSGIAIGPILFIIAILAILAAAIAASSSSFSGGTSNESSKTIASTLLQQVYNIEDGVNIVRGNNFDDNQISFMVPDNQFICNGGDFGQSAGNGYSVTSCTSSICKIYDQGGAGVTPVNWPSTATNPGFGSNLYGRN